MKARARFVLALAVVSAAGVACVLADPPNIEQIPPPQQPFIITGSVSPPLDQPIGALPSSVQSLSFAVPVETDPDETLQWRVFIDDDTSYVISASGSEDGGVMATAPGEAGVGYRVIQFSLQASVAIDFSACHRFKVVVAYAFANQLSCAACGSAPSDQPAYPPGGDTATWFYEPISDCNIYDAAPPYDADVPDVGDDE